MEDAQKILGILMREVVVLAQVPHRQLLQVLCSFAIGTETLGSITSPSQRCGTTGLRPTFGRVSRQGGMALCWSLDKVGPICRCLRINYF